MLCHGLHTPLPSSRLALCGRATRYLARALWRATVFGGGWAVNVQVGSREDTPTGRFANVCANCPPSALSRPPPSACSPAPTGLGLSCRLRGDIRDDPIAKWYCMNCDPEQPDYIRQASHPSHRGEDKDAVMLVLTSWASSEFGSDPILAGPDNRFKECGLLRSSPCLDHKGDAIDDRDRYTCGDDPYYPSSAIVIDAKDGSVDLKKSLEKFMMDIDMGPPALDDYGYKLIDDCTTPCTEDALKEHYAAALKGGAGAPSLMQPECIRTADQLTVTPYSLGVKNSKGAEIDTSFQDYFCTTQETPASCYDKEDKHLDCTNGKIKQNNPCCCAAWKDEKCFSAASGLFSTTAAVWFALVAVAMHMLVA